MARGDETDIPVIAVGASAGGLEALRDMFGGFSGRPGMAFVVVQHLDPNHDSLMAQLLERYTDMEVTQAAGGESLEVDHIYVIPPAHGLAIEDNVLRLTEFKDPRGMRRPIDDFFESLAAERGARAGCVILSGTGGDGSRGLRAIKEYGGLAIVQEPATARYDGMPVAAIATGLVDITVPPAQVIEALRNFFDRADVITLDEAEKASDHIDEMCKVLRDAIGHDFSGYKRSTLSRRIARRMQVIDVATSEQYLARLKADPGECQALFRDLLINVTRFFRDREEFEKLDKEVIEPMIAASRDASEIRVWVAGCSSGEEAYSVAMLIAEAMRRHERRPYVQIFATDIDDKMLEIAKMATYPLAALADIPPEFQMGYVQVGPDSFTISPRIRDMVRFSTHNLVRDPPYSKIDLVCCRNLLIYFDEKLQREVLPAFHFALVPGGRLFLGSSETIGRFEDLFATIDQRARIFERRETHTRYPINFSPRFEPRRRMPSESPPADRKQISIDVAALTRVAERHAPVSLLVDSEGVLLNSWGAVGRYLAFPDRRDVTLNAIRQAKPGLSELLGPMLRDVARTGQGKIARDVTVDTEFGKLPVQVILEPVGSGAFLVVLKDSGALEPRSGDHYEDYERGDSEVSYLQEELQTTRLRLRTTVEELETANEELKSSNEEMMSMNEELQSTNEELTTVNDELKAKVDQVTTAHSDLKNFYDTIDLAVMVVDAKLSLRSFTEAAGRLFELGNDALGVPLQNLATVLREHDYVQLAKDAAQTGRISEFRTATEDGERKYYCRVLPYRLLDGKLAGATLVFNEVTRVLELEEQLVAERARLRMSLEVARIGTWEYEPATGRTYMDETEKELLGLEHFPEHGPMEKILDHLPGEDRDKVNAALLRAMDGKSDYDETFRVNLADGSQRWLHGLGRKIDAGDTSKFIGVTYDVTDERELLAERELMLREMNHRVKNLFAVITGLTKMSARHADSVEEFSQELCERIQALGVSHGLTMDHEEDGARLRDLLAAALKAGEESGKVTLEGEAVLIPRRQITPLAMIFHEWATNATKYGGLASEEGSLDVSWTQEGDRVAIDWKESYAPEGEPGPDGFGSQLIRLSAQQLAGTATAAQTIDGFARTLEFPIPS